MNILVTAGATREPVDGVRFISNVSTGRTGAALADQLVARGHGVALLLGEGGAEPRAVSDVERFGSAADLERRLRVRLAQGGWDAVIMAAAVADYRPRAARRGKMDSAVPERTLRLVRTPKILPRIRSFGTRPPVVIGFKLTAGAGERARRAAVAAQFAAGGVDVVVHNDLEEIQAGAGHPFSVHAGAGAKPVRVVGTAALAPLLESLLRAGLRRLPAGSARAEAAVAAENAAGAVRASGAETGRSRRTLVLNIGNTTLFGGICANGRVSAQFREPIATPGRPSGAGSPARLWEAAGRRLARRIRGRIDAAALCSVVPSLTAPAERWIRRTWGIRPAVLHPGADHGLRIGYRRPAELGSDRLAAVLGARSRWPDRNVIVVDCGTATTVTVLRADGRVCGGAILPGAGLWGDMLAARTARLPGGIRAAVPRRTIGLTPREAIASGIFHGHAGAIREIVRLSAGEAFGRAADVVAGTGGNAPLFARAGVFDTLVADLVLCGLADFAHSVGPARVP